MVRAPLLAMLVILPMAAASQANLQADLDVAGTAALKGTGDLDISVGGAIYDHRHAQGPGGQLRLDGAFVYVLYRTEERFLVGEPGSALGTRQVLLSSQTTTEVEGDSAGSWWTRSEGKVYSVRVIPDAPAMVSWHNGLYMATPMDVAAELAGRGMYSDADIDIGYPSRGAPWNPHEPMEFEAPFRAQIFGQDVWLPNGTQLHTGIETETGHATPDGTRLVTIVYRTLVLSGDGRASFNGPWQFQVSSLRGSLQGDIELTKASGRVMVGEDTREHDLDLFQAVGQFQVEADFVGSPAVWAIDGQASFVGGNTQTLVGDRRAGLAIAAGTLTLAALIGAALKTFGREALAALRLGTTDALGHPRRLEILRLLGQEPGLSPEHLRAEMGVGRATVLHHLRILGSAHLISRYRPGKIPHYTLNGGSAEFEVPAADGKTIAATTFFTVASSRIRRTIVNLLDEGALTVHEIQARWPGEVPPSRQAMEYHIRKLSDAGVLERMKDDSRRFYLAVDKQCLQEQYARRFAKVIRGDEILRRCQRVDGCTLSEIAVDGTAATWPEPVRLLEAAGLISFDDQARRFKA